MRRPERFLAGLLVLAACAPRPTTTPAPNMDPGRTPPPPAAVPPPPPPPASPILPASEAFRRGLLPVTSTNVWAYRQDHPTYDGRGVLIGVMDSGIDPTIPGLGVTSTGDPKIVDLRDFSGEGRVPLTAIAPSGDSLTVDGVTVRGLARVAGFNPQGPFYLGTLVERRLGEMPASDLNGNGTNRDRLPVVVTRATDGWVLFADTDGDGSLENERPVHDYLQARETFGWSTGGRPSPLGVAVNLADSAGVPRLDLVFDNSGHGSHVTGIASGHDLYGVKGFDGVAPGAQVLGLKIANDALGGISVTGSMVRAMDYAVRFAKDRGLPLVLNLSFGVGNEQEGKARIDALMDSVLAANPGVVLTTSAGNDGPGLSTMGFPASAALPITIGATWPAVFTGRPVGDVVAFFSARGAELAKPDVVAPGIAYSSVPRWNTGDENKSGTSMASPHAAGVVALLLSAAKQDGRTVTAAQVKQAMVGSARPLADALPVGQGAGLIDVVAADAVLRRLPAIATMRAQVGSLPSGGAYRLLVTGDSPDTTVTLSLEGALPGPIRLRSDAAWLQVPASVTLTPPRTTVSAVLRTGILTAPGVYAGTITGWASDTTIGPLFRTTATAIRPATVPDSGYSMTASLPPGGNARLFFAADTARPFHVRVGAGRGGQTVLGFLYEPGGQPNRTDNLLPGGFGDRAANYEIDARDLEPGVYEAVAAAPPGDSATAVVTVTRSPVELRAARTHRDTVVATVTNREAGSVSGAVMFGLVGAERRLSFSQRGGAARRVPVRVPAWARRLVVELTLPREEWPLFTDLGLSVFDGSGQLLKAEPLNYHLGRLAIEVPSGLAGHDAVIEVSPGFADPVPTALWSGELGIRFYTETPSLVTAASATEFQLAPGATTTSRFVLGKLPFALGDGFFPLGNLVVDARGTLWGRETPLPEPAPPVMR